MTPHHQPSPHPSSHSFLFPFRADCLYIVAGLKKGRGSFLSRRATGVSEEIRPRRFESWLSSWMRGRVSRRLGLGGGSNKAIFRLLLVLQDKVDEGNLMLWGGIPILHNFTSVFQQ